MSEKKLVINSSGDEKFLDGGFVRRKRRIPTNPVDSFYCGMRGFVADGRGTVRIVPLDQKVGEDVNYFEQSRLVSLRSREGLHKTVSKKIIFGHHDLPKIMRDLVNKLRDDDLGVLREQAPESNRKPQEQKSGRLQRFLKAFIN